MQFSIIIIYPDGVNIHKRQSMHKQHKYLHPNINIATQQHQQQLLHFWERPVHNEPYVLGCTF